MELTTPFRESEHEWRIQQSGVSNGKVWAMVLCYVQNRAIQNRLDELYTPFGWQNEFREWKNGAQLCGISIHVESANYTGWITKWDGADDTDVESVKGGLSDSMKRCAVQWGIGRYLYELESTFAECSTDKQTGKGWHKAKTGETIFWWKEPKLPEGFYYNPEIDRANKEFNKTMKGLEK
jgi:hypothetical protein